LNGKKSVNDKRTFAWKKVYSEKNE